MLLSLPHQLFKRDLEQMNTMNIYAEVVFGNPKLDCARFGICKILFPDEMQFVPLRFGRALAKLSHEAGTTKVRLSLFKESMSDWTEKYYFSHHTLFIEEDSTPFVSSDFDVFWQEIQFQAGIYAFDDNWTTTIAIAEHTQFNKVVTGCDCEAIRA
jgi:hypothetical protein